MVSVLEENTDQQHWFSSRGGSVGYTYVRRVGANRHRHHDTVRAELAPVETTISEHIGKQACKERFWNGFWVKDIIGHRKKGRCVSLNVYIWWESGC